MNAKQRQRLNEALIDRQEAHYIQILWQQDLARRRDIANLVVVDEITSEAAQRAMKWLSANIDGLLYDRINELVDKAEKAIDEV